MSQFEFPQERVGLASPLLLQEEREGPIRLGWEGEEGERSELLRPMACLAPLPPHPDPLLLKEEREVAPFQVGKTQTESLLREGRARLRERIGVRG